MLGVFAQVSANANLRRENNSPSVAPGGSEGLTSPGYQGAPGTVVSMVTRVALKVPVTCASGGPEALTISLPSQLYTSRVKGPEK
jgi:hypothetical protein